MTGAVTEPETFKFASLGISLLQWHACSQSPPCLSDSAAWSASRKPLQPQQRSLIIWIKYSRVHSWQLWRTVWVCCAFLSASVNRPKQCVLIPIRQVSPLLLQSFGVSCKCSWCPLASVFDTQSLTATFILSVCMVFIGKWTQFAQVHATKAPS